MMVFSIVLIAALGAVMAVLLMVLISYRRLQERCGRLDAEKGLLEGEKRVTDGRIGQLERDADAQRALAQEWQSQNVQLREDLAATRARMKALTEERADMERQAEARFKALATDVLRANSEDLRRGHREQLDTVLTPLKTDLEAFRKTFREVYDTENRDRASLAQHIKDLMAMSQTIGQEARELTNALKGNAKVQGDWGEEILESILQRSGLLKGVQYTVQESTAAPDEEGQRARLRADVVVYYPNGRTMVIDSKVSLTAYVRYVNAQDADEAKAAGREHVASVRSHVNELHSKGYQDYLGTLKADFVMMFIPHEGAYLTAMQLDPQLWEKAYDDRVIIVSPTHLISVMKLLEQLWQHDRQTKNAIQIATDAGKMLDKLVGFVEDMVKIQNALSAAQVSYENAQKKMEGRGGLLISARKLRDLGARMKKADKLGQDPDQEEGQPTAELED